MNEKSPQLQLPATINSAMYVLLHTFRHTHTCTYLCVCMGELLLGVSPRSGMCAPVRVVGSLRSGFLYDVMHMIIGVYFSLFS